MLAGPPSEGCFGAALVGGLNGHGRLSINLHVPAES